MRAGEIKKFQNTILGSYETHSRTFPWRHAKSPYEVLVSEFMLQQTQTSRVLLKYEPFIRAFPNFHALASAPLNHVLRHWQGLGYNRRALMLQKTAHIVAHEFGGVLPADPALLGTLPGIGSATAGALCTFAFHLPVIFIETNIRAVFLHFFFPNQQKVHDTAILPLIKQTLDAKNPQRWYYALMDYGVLLKKHYPRINEQSAHYHKQSVFKNSNRQIRGQILKLLLKNGSSPVSSLQKELNIGPSRLKHILCDMEEEGFLARKGSNIQLASAKKMC